MVPKCHVPTCPLQWPLPGWPHAGDIGCQVPPVPTTCDHVPGDPQSPSPESLSPLLGCHCVPRVPSGFPTMVAGPQPPPAPPAQVGGTSGQGQVCPGCPQGRSHECVIVGSTPSRFWCLFIVGSPQRGSSTSVMGSPCSGSCWFVFAGCLQTKVTVFISHRVPPEEVQHVCYCGVFPGIILGVCYCRVSLK